MNEKITTPHSPDSWDEQFVRHRAGKETDIYARNSYEGLREYEEEIAGEIGVPEAAVLNSGMAAIHTAIEAEELRAGEVVLASDKVYSGTGGLFDDLKKRGVRVEIIKPEETADIVQKIKDLKPSAIILESVANAREMRMADLGEILPAAEEASQRYQTENTPAALLDKRLGTEKMGKRYESLGEKEKEAILKAVADFRETNNYFCLREAVEKIEDKIGLDHVEKTEDKTGLDRREIIEDLADLVGYVLKNERSGLTLIVDNTLPSIKNYNPLAEIKDGAAASMVVVESGTKHYQAGADKITFGLAYSQNPEKIKAIKKERTKLGTYLQPSSLKEIPPDSLEVMEKKMARHSQNALCLAEGVSSTGKAVVYHPNLEGHPDKELADRFAPEGIVTMFYFDLKEMAANEFARRAYEKGGGKIKIGVGFGHNETWLAPLGEKTIRVAAGCEEESEASAVAESFKKALE